MTISKMQTKFIVLSLITAKVLLAESLSEVLVIGEVGDDSTNVSATKISSKEIRESISGNGFISSLLKDNPNINVTDVSENSSTAGEITPGKISIHGAAFYQNNIQIDGISNNSLIDPSLSSNYNPYDVPGNENESFVDLDLVESIDVYDSNISAEYGSFTGGVIDAKTIRAKDELSYKMSYKFTSDSLTNFHIAKDQKRDFEDAISDSFQPRFEKKFYNMYISSPIDESNGIIFSYARKESVIPGAYLNTFKDKTRLNQNAMVKYSHYFKDDAILDITGTYAPYESTHIQKEYKDSDTTIKGGGYSLKANYEKNFNFWSLYSNLSFKGSSNTKESLNYNKEWLNNQGDKNWGFLSSLAKEGGSGNIEKEQKGVNFNLKLESEAFNTWDIEHKLKTGFSANFDNGSYNRKNNTYYYTDAKAVTGLICNGNNESCDDNYQYFQTRRVYQAEDISVDMLSGSFYVEDKLTYKSFEFTPGFRVDYNDYLKNMDIAHRLNSSFKPFNNDKTIIYGGVNRYYGKSFLGYKLREARLPYYDQHRGLNYPSPQEWGTSAVQDKDRYEFSDLDTPYSDELSLGLRQDFFGMRLNLKHVQRDSKKEFSSKYGEYAVYKRADGQDAYFRPRTFENGGSSETKTTSIRLTPVKPIGFSWGDLSYSLSTAFINSSYNLSSYDSILDDEAKDDYGKVYYNGKAVNSSEVGVTDSPRNYNLNIGMDFNPVNIFGKNVKIHLNNSFKYTSKYNTILPVEDLEIPYEEPIPNSGGLTNTTDLKVYENDTLDSTFTYDLKLSFDVKLKDKHHLIINTEINNVFDEVANIENDPDNYKTGRQFWFEIAYKY